MAKGWLDNYGVKENANESSVSLPEGFVGMGNNTKGRNYSPAWGGQFEDGGEIPMAQKGYQTSKDSVAHQVDKMLKYEQLRGGPGGTPLPQYADPQYMEMLMNKIYPEVQKIMPKASAIETGEAMDYVFNAGWDKNNNKITKDPRAIALQEYYRKYDKSKLDKDGKWAGRKNAAYSFDDEYANTIGKLSKNERRLLMNKGRDWYYQNINNPSPGVPSSDYNDTWYGRIWNTNDYKPFDPNNPNFTPKKQMGGNVYPVNYVPQAQMGMSMPGATGNMYARVGAPSKGPRRNQTDVTDASAQNGKEMKFYQEGLDWKPKTISQNGGWLDGYEDDISKAQWGETLTPKQAELKKQVERNNRKIETQNKYNEYQENKRKAADLENKKAQAKSYVQANMENVTDSFLWNLPGSISPMAVEDLIVGGAGKGIKHIVSKLDDIKNINSKGKIFSGINNELNNMAVQNTERYMAKRTPTTSTLSPKMEPYVSRYTKLSEEPYIPYQEDEYMKWFNKQKAKMNPSTPVQDPRSILRRSSVIDINDLPNNNFELFDLNNVRKPSGSIGNQGATSEGARDILKSIGIEVESAKPGQPTLKEMVEHLKNNPNDATKYQKFLEKEPINISELPDGSYQINDGHHRATLSYYSGNENIPTIIKNKGEYIKQRDGGIIKDDRGQWDHPGEITEIGSNQITMQGVPYDVIGISDTGDTKLMKPGKNYKFKGKKVTEFPMAQNGIRQEQKGLQNLDNLTNFTNYNTKQPGGWLNKYN